MGIPSLCPSCDRISVKLQLTVKSRDDPITYNRYGSFAVLVVEDESPETQENVDEANERVETEVVREHFTF